MPGTSVLYGAELLQASLDDLKLENDFIIKKLIETPDFSLVVSGFEGYPYYHYLTQDYSFYLEGLIYNMDRDEIESEVSKIATAMIKQESVEKGVLEFITKASGEYIALVYASENNDFIIFNDSWGRLPFFYYNSSLLTVASREPKFLLYYVPEIQYDKNSMLEYLVIRYPLGDKTVFSNISRLLPGHMLKLNHNKFECKKLISMNFDRDSKSRKSTDYYVQKAKDILLSSTHDCLSKMDKFSSVTVDISGGYDSRAILATVSQFDKSVKANTIALITGDESETAMDVAEACGVEIIHVKPERDFSYSTVSDLVYKTDGFVNGLTTITCFEDRLCLRSMLERPVAEFEGFGGEFLRHPLKSKRFFKNMLDVIDYDILSKSLIESTCDCLGLNINDVLDFWSSFFKATYNETDIESQVMHYYFDYYNLYVGAGEDRSRVHVWPVCPMMSIDWLKFSTSEVPRNIIGFELFEKILAAIDEKVSVSRIPIWGTGFWKSRIFEFIDNHRFSINLGKSYYRRKWKRQGQNNPKRAEMVQMVLDLYDKSPSIQKYFNRNEAIQFMKNEYGPNNRFLWQLLSLFMYMNIIDSKHKKII